MKHWMWMILGALPLLANAHNLQLHQPLPPVSISRGGELVLRDNHIEQRTWDASRLAGKVRIIQHIAGRSSAKELNAPLIEAIKAAELPRDGYQTVTIINVDDALFGTSGLVRSSAENSKKQYPWSSIVVDEDGRVGQAWQLARKGSAIIVLDPQGRVNFVKEGALSPRETKQVLGLVTASLNQ